MQYPTLAFENGKLRLIDQRHLPDRVDYFTTSDYSDVAWAISEMVVRGAPAIGAAAAYGLCLAALEYRDCSRNQFIKKLEQAAEELAGARPTAVNLTWAVNRMLAKTDGTSKSPDHLTDILLSEAEQIRREDVETNHQMARHGSKLIEDGDSILTHCNAGALATCGYGTALGVIREAFGQGKGIHVFVDETRPRLQGARLTAFELKEEGIPATLVADSAAASLLRAGKIDCVVVGADRIASNGDTANKIGTFMLSIICAKYRVPFYVAAPVSTIDFAIESGEEITIEERDPHEVTHISGARIPPEGITVYNPAFDVTPRENITAYITELGIIEPPFREEDLV